MLKIQLVTDLAEKERLTLHIPYKLRETLDDPAIVLSLNPVLRNRLCRIEMYTLFKISQKGRAYLKQKKFTDSELQKIDAVFAKYKCSHLFK